MPRGGKRLGAGRPSEDKVKVSVTLDADLVEYLRTQGQLSQVLNALVRKSLPAVIKEAD
ncbi:MAG: hypothetical protein H7Y37_03520 [Anaerolineae bacterium]|nr:hypothetical protein [Gloeobacterales cyanobacterium ES-bin-313]